MDLKIKKIKLRVRHFFLALTKVISRGEITQNSIIIAYYTLFSIFPIIIIFGNVLPLFNIDTKPIAKYLELIFPSQVSSLIMPIINGLLKKHSSGFISFGIIIAVWSFSGLINSVRLAMNRIYGVYNKEKGQPWWYTVIARSFNFIITTVLVLVFALAIFAFTFGRQIMEILAPIFHFSLSWVYQLENYRWPAIVIMMIIIILYLNYALPNIDTQKRKIWPGVLVTAFSWGALSYFFGIYIHNFGTRWQNYGIIGSFIVFMLWLNFGALLLLVGTCVNATLDLLRQGPARYSTNSVISFVQRHRK